MRKPVADRFWAKVDKSPGLGPNGDCWEWSGSCARELYSKGGHSYRSLGAMFGVSYEAVRLAVNARTWRHMPEVESALMEPKMATEKARKMAAYESLNAKERIMVEAKAAGATTIEAAKVAGYSPNAHAFKRVNRPAFKDALRECFEAIGLDPEGVAARLKDGADNAKQYLQVKDKQGAVTIEERPDPHAQAKYLDMIMKSSGAYPMPTDQGAANVQVVVIGPENSLAAANPFSAPVVESGWAKALPESASGA